MGRPIRVAASLVSLGLLAACSSGKATKIVTVTVPAPRPVTTPSAGGVSGTVSSSPSPTVSRQTKLNGTCDTLLPDYSVEQALGGKPLGGTTAFVVGKPEPDISRIAYLNCRYGITGTGASAIPKIEIGMSLYTSSEKAAVRITATADDYTAHGATATDTPVRGKTGKLLTGGVGTGYDEPVLVVASGQRTVAVSVGKAFATGSAAAADATKIASLTLRRTGG
jgi:hypothetical protein